MYKPIIENEKINFSNLIHFIRLMFLSYYRVAFLFSLIYAGYFFFLKDTKYSASMSFYTNYKEETGIAMVFAQSFGGQEFNNLNFSIRNFLNSETFYKKIIYDKYDSKKGRKNLIDIWGIKGNAPLIIIDDIPELTAEDRKYLKARKQLKDSIKFTEDQKTGLHKISVIIKRDSQLALTLIENIYDAILYYSAEVTATKGVEKSAFIEKRLNEVTLQLEKNENELIEFLDKNKSLDSPYLSIQRGRIQREINVNNSIFLSLSNQLELAKIEEKNNTSSVFILDSPKLSDKKPGRGLFLNMIIIFIGIGGLASLRVMYLNKKELFRI